MEIFDSHTHLDDVLFRGKEEIYLDRARELGVVKSAVIERDPELSERTIDLSQGFNNLYAITGYCPDVAKGYDQNIEDVLVEQLKKPKTVALGEIGLDYYWDESPRDVQRKVFAGQLNLTHSLRVSVNIHTHDAFESTYQVLKNSHVDEYGGITHNFNGDPERPKRFLDLRMMVSFSGVVSFTKAINVHAPAKVVPWDKFLIEAGVPYLTPKPYRGKQNETGYARYIAEAIAKLRDVSIEEMAKHTFENTMRAYGIK